MMTSAGINLTQLDQYAIQPVLAAFGAPWNNAAAAVLLLGTAIHESNAGEYLAQTGGGPALGAWQMEPATHDDCWQNFLQYQPALAASVRQFQVPRAGAAQMAWNLGYACAMARVKYIRAQPPLPAANDFAAMAAYYKQFYNSDLGAAVVDLALVDCFALAAQTVGAG